ncbi:uncharacterized protein LOC120213176 [Hibiscus syriacus]|uniref:uncharacterized protein LOC120213176 n=1 Tax=Hibiscus syriacus TaxID=106335 RepID=UPI001923B997|nr:uncharacterized protein LOC120213176 [Hibiscus syriacus]
MSISLKLTPSFALHVPHRGFNQIPSLTFSTGLISQNFKKLSCSINNERNTVNGPIDNGNYSANNEGSTAGKSESSQGESFSPKDVLKRLRRYGVAGVLSYGLLNTAYYLTTFLVVWFYVAPVPGRMGYMAAVERLLKIMAMVWAGSQVTKLIRAGGALALAPLVDRGLSWFTLRFKFDSQGKASMVIVGFCFGLALMLFLVVTVLWA